MSTTNVDTDENPNAAEAAGAPESDALTAAQNEAAKWKDAT